MIDMLVTQSGLSEDTIINLLPFILMEIRNYTKQYFLTKHHLKVDKIENGTIYLTGDAGSEMQVGDTVELMNSENNTLIYQINNIDGNTITLEQDIIDEVNNEDIVLIKLSFKNVNIRTIINMLKYDEEFGGMNGIKSQTLGGYNVTYATPSGDSTYYPIELYGGLNSLRKVDDNFAEYRRKGYVRL